MTMIFSEFYSTYYHTVSAVLSSAVDHPLRENELEQIVKQHAFGESFLNIIPALKEQRWQLLREDGTTPLKHEPSLPLTILQKQWLKAISYDPRIRLFTDCLFDFPDVEPLFLPDDIKIVDQYLDGDPFEDETYIQNFRLILDAIKNKEPLSIEMISRKGCPKKQVVLPEYLEYSEKDDKFRRIARGNPFGSTINLARIVSCKRYEKPYQRGQEKLAPARLRTVIFELIDQRKALERVLLHFAHFEKQAEKLEEGRYRITLTYDKEDETEILIRVLSFGPMLKVVAPRHFIELIKQRLIDQKSCEL